MTLEALRLEALKLPEDEREDLGYELIRSLDSAHAKDQDYDRLWNVEIERRIRAIEDGSEELIPDEEVYASIRAEFA